MNAIFDVRSSLRQDIWSKLQRATQNEEIRAEAKGILKLFRGSLATWVVHARPRFDEHAFRLVSRSHDVSSLWWCICDYSPITKLDCHFLLHLHLQAETRWAAESRETESPVGSEKGSCPMFLKGLKRVFKTWKSLWLRVPGNTQASRQHLNPCFSDTHWVWLLNLTSRIGVGLISKSRVQAYFFFLKYIRYAITELDGWQNQGWILLEECLKIWGLELIVWKYNRLLHLLELASIAVFDEDLPWVMWVDGGKCGDWDSWKFAAIRKHDVHKAPHSSHLCGLQAGKNVPEDQVTAQNCIHLYEDALRV